MNGYEYEQKCAILLKAKGFSNIAVTQCSGDQGIDIIAYKAETKYGVQCKYYTGTVGNKAVQEAYAGAAYYGCATAMVITNSTLSKSASELAKELNVEVWEHIDAIYLQKNSKKATIDYEHLTQKEREELQVKEIEAYLQEKYRAFYIKYPEDVEKDAEIEDYVSEIKYRVDDYDSSYRQKLDSIFFITKYKTFKNWRDPEITNIKSEARECTKEFGIKLKTILDEANIEAEHYMSTGLSVESIAKLSDLISHIFEIGDDISVSANEKTIARFVWPEKYMRIKHKWKLLKEKLPTDPKQEDILKERSQKEKLQQKLNIAKENLKKAQEDIQTAQDYINTIPDTLEKETNKLKDIENSYTKKCEEFQATYCHIETMLTDKQSATKERLGKLQTDKKIEIENLNKLFILSFKKKENLKKHINELDRNIEEVKQIYKNTEVELLQAKRTYEADIQALKDRLANSRRQVDTIEQKVSENKATIKSKKSEIAKLEREIDNLKEQLKDFHKKYLLKNYKYNI